MRYFIAALFTGLLMAVASPAFATCTTLPFTLLPGVPPDGAKMMANLQALNDDCASAASQIKQGSATLWPPPSDVTFGPPSKQWVQNTPDGTVPSCGSTSSNCAQEILNFMLTKGSTDIYGGGDAVGSNAVVTFTGTLATPVLRNAYVRLHGGGLFQTGTPAVGTAAVTLDSMVEGAFMNEGGQIASASTTSAGGGAASGSMPAVLLDPHTVLPIEGFTGIGASRIDLGNTTVQWAAGQSDSCVKASLAHAGITRNLIDAVEINGGGPSPTTAGCQNGYAVTDYPGGLSPNSYTQNMHRFGFVHLFSNFGVADGLNATDGAAVFQNIYDVGGIEPRGASSVGVVAFGKGSVFRVGGVDNIGGAVLGCAAAGSGASDVHINVGCWADATNISTGINFAAGSSNNTGWIRAVETNGGAVANLAQDGGTNNIVWRGATAYSLSGLKLVSVDAGGVQTGGAIITGTALTVPSLQTTTAGGGKSAVCYDTATGAFYRSTSASC